MKILHIEVLIFGSSFSEEIAKKIPYPVHFVGHLHNDFSLVMVYNCMDVFVIPSLAEAFGQTIIESLACNVPVVGFNIGGIPDMVNGYTGYLAEYNNSEDLAKGITVVLKEGKTNVREYVKSFSLESIVDKHNEMWNIEGFQ